MGRDFTALQHELRPAGFLDLHRGRYRVEA
jgi:hypothetical protein